MNLTLLTSPAAEPVSLAEAKAWLRVDTADQDGAIGALIAAARALVEATTRRQLMTQTWRLAFDAWPFDAGLDGALAALATRPASAPLAASLPLAPLASVSAVRVYDAVNQAQAIASAQWRLTGAPERARLVFSQAPPQPGRTSEGVEIDVIAGYGAAFDTPAPLRQAILMLTAHWFENRGETPTGDMPDVVRTLLAPFMRRRLA